MSQRRYAIFDGSSLGANLELDAGGVDLLTLASGLTPARNARSTLTQSRGEHYVEFIPYGTGALTGKLRIGLCSEGLGVDVEPGTTADSMALRSEGGVFCDDSSLSATSALSARVVVGMLLRFNDVGGGDASFYAGDALLATVAIPASLEDVPLAFVVGLGSNSEAADIRVRVNAGRDRFEQWPPPAEGFFDIPVTGGAIRIGSRPYVSGSNDTPPLTRWEQGIEGSDLAIDRQLSFWIWRNGAGAARGGAVSLTVADPNGILNPTLSGAYRDLPAQLQWMDDGTSVSAAEDLGQWSIEKVEPVDALRRRITLRDRLASMERPLQRRLIRPDASPEAANQPWPTTIGACFSVEPVLIDQSNFEYAIDSVGASQVGRVRDKGDPLDLLAIPPDYEVNAGGQTITLASVPVGLVTVDASATGTGYIPESPVDILGGDGAPFTGTLGAIPTNWTLTNDNGFVTNPPVQLGSSNRLLFIQENQRYSILKHDTAVFQEGRSYVVTFTMHNIIGRTSTMSATFSFNRANSVLETHWHARSGYSYDTLGQPVPGLQATNPITGAVPLAYTFSFVYSPTATHPVYLSYYGNNFIDGPACSISNLTIIELPEVDTTTGDDELEESLIPTTLEATLREVIENRGELPPAIWQSSDAAAIDTATGYSGLGYHTRGQAMVREAVDALLDSYTASMAPDRSGVLRVVRLVKPEDETAVATLTNDDLISEPLPRWDDAPGLTRTLGCRPNERVLTDSDLVTDEVEVTFALRRKLARKFRFICTSGAPILPQYAHADANEPLPTRLVKRVDGQAEIDRVCGMFTVARSFWTAEIRWRDDFDLGDVITLVDITPGLGLELGVNFQVVGIREYPLQRKMTLTLWGLAVDEV